MPFDAAAAELPRIHRAVAADIPRLVEIARQTYPDYDLDGATSWANAIIEAPNAAILFCGQSVAIVAWQIEFWRRGEKVADILPFYSVPNGNDPWATYRVLKAAAKWAREQGCYAIRFGSSYGAKSAKDRGIDLFEPFAKRFGAKPWGVTYIKEL